MVSFHTGKNTLIWVLSPGSQGGHVYHLLDFHPGNPCLTPAQGKLIFWEKSNREKLIAPYVNAFIISKISIISLTQGQ